MQCFHVFFFHSPIFKTCSNICVYGLLIHAKAVRKKNCHVQGGNKEFFTLLHKVDLIVFCGNSEHESTYVDIIFL